MCKVTHEYVYLLLVSLLSEGHAQWLWQKTFLFYSQSVHKACVLCLNRFVQLPFPPKQTVSPGTRVKCLFFSDSEQTSQTRRFYMSMQFFLVHFISFLSLSCSLQHITVSQILCFPCILNHIAGRHILFGVTICVWPAVFCERNWTANFEFLEDASTSLPSLKV